MTNDISAKAINEHDKELLNDVKTLGEDKFEKRILCFCNTKKQLSYYELEYQFKYKVLFIDSYNENINGTYFRKDFEISK